MPSSIQLQSEIERLKAENVRLVALLETHGIPWIPDTVPTDKKVGTTFHSTILSADEKVALFRSLFRGRSDVYPIRWESSTTGKSGYSPACANEWKRGVCPKPQVKCSACDYRELLPLTNQTIFDHLTRKQTIGVCPLLANETCYFNIPNVTPSSSFFESESFGGSGGIEQVAFGDFAERPFALPE